MTNNLLISLTAGVVAAMLTTAPDATDAQWAAAVSGGTKDNCPDSPTEGLGTACEEPTSVVVERCTKCEHAFDQNGVAFHRKCIVDVDSKACGGYDGPGNPAPVCYQCSKPCGGEDNSAFFTSGGDDLDYCDNEAVQFSRQNCSRDYAFAFANGEEDRHCAIQGGPGGNF